MYNPISDRARRKIRRLPDGRMKYFGEVALVNGKPFLFHLMVGFGNPVGLHGSTVQLLANAVTKDFDSGNTGAAVEQRTIKTQRKKELIVEEDMVMFISMSAPKLHIFHLSICCSHFHNASSSKKNT